MTVQNAECYNLQYNTVQYNTECRVQYSKEYRLRKCTVHNITIQYRVQTAVLHFNRSKKNLFTKNTKIDIIPLGYMYIRWVVFYSNNMITFSEKR